MHKGAKFLGFTAILVLVACGDEKGKLTIRSTGTPLSSETKSLSSMVAEGRSQFALGNFALALQSFRKAARDEPGNIDAVIGVASCYDRMGHYDLSRKHYEAALAVEPANEHALTALAGSLDLQGMAKEAAAVRNEVRQRLADRVASSPAPSEQTVLRQLATIDLESVVRSMLLADKAQLARKPAVATTLVKSPASTAAQLGSASDVQVKSDLDPVRKEVSPASAQNVTIKLPPPRQVANSASRHTPVSELIDVFSPDARAPEPSMAAPVIAVPMPDRAAEPIVLPSTFAKAIKFEPEPRLERMSAVEVNLVTRNAPPMRVPRVVQRTTRSSTIRFVPLLQAQARVPIRVLNAARVDRLAADTRMLMSRQGWKNVAIGNASMVHSRSVVLYPPSARPAAQRLAAQLGFVSALRAGSGEVTVLLGRDAAALAKKRAPTS